MTKVELIYNVREKLKLNSDDSETSDELISHLIDLKRVKILQQRIDKSPWRAPIEFKQEIRIDLEVVDSVDGMSCFGGILRTTLEVPNMVRSKGGNGGITVRRADKQALLIDIIGLDRLPFAGNGAYLSQLTYASFDYDNKLYLVSNQKKHLLQKSILVGGIFEDSEKAGDLDPSVDQSIDVWDRQYPLTLDLADIAVEMVVKDLAKSTPIVEDKVNDAD